MISATQYVDKKRKGLVEVQKVGEFGFVMSVKQFSAEDGSELDPKVFTVSLQQLKERKAALEMEAKNLGKLIEDLESMQSIALGEAGKKK